MFLSPKTSFYDYFDMLLEERSLFEFEVDNSDYLQQTYSVAKAHNVELAHLLAVHRGYLYPFLLPLRVEDSEVFRSLARILARAYKRVSVPLNSGFAPEDFQDTVHTDDLKNFLKILEQVSH